MPRTHEKRRAWLAPLALLAVLPAALGLAACGGSSKSSAGATNVRASTTGGKGGGRFAARASALRECLKKNGITLPEPRVQGGPGAGGPGGPYGGQPPAGGTYGQPPSGTHSGLGPFASGAVGPRLPKGVSRAQFQAAIKKCGGGALRVRGGDFDTAQGRQRYAKFAECMRKNGVKLPAPNTSGDGPIFNTTGIDTNSAAFKAADAKCAKELRPSGTNSGGPGVGGGAGPAGAGPAGEGGPAGSQEAAPPEGAPPGA